jgi:hypothetical protein
MQNRRSPTTNGNPGSITKKLRTQRNVAVSLLVVVSLTAIGLGGAVYYFHADITASQG